MEAERITASAKPATALETDKPSPYRVKAAAADLKFRAWVLIFDRC